METNNETLDAVKEPMEQIPLYPLPSPRNSDDPSTSSGYSTNAQNSPATVLNNDDAIQTLLDNPCRTTTRNRPNRAARVTFIEPVLEEDSLLEVQANSNTDATSPPDGGYGWVVVAASFGVQMLGISLAMCFGVMYIEFQDYYGVEAAVVAWVGAICVGLALGAGPLSSMLANAVGLRVSCLIGGFVTSLGLFISAYSPSIYFLYISYGVITGIGISLSYVPAVVIVGFYFEQRRLVASGLSVAGIGFGSLIYPPLIQILIETFTWRGTMIILSGICLHILVFASLLRPLPFKDCHKSNICDVDLLKDYTFIIFSAAEILWNIGCLIITTIAPHHSILGGVEPEKAAFLLSIIGIAGTLGRVVFVFIPLHWDKLTMMTVATYVSGLPMVMYPLLPYYWAHVVHCTVYGFCFGVQLAVLPVVTVDLFGLERLTSAYGYLVLADGIGALFGPFLGGLLYDTTGDYNLSFIVGALTAFVSGVLMTALLAQRMCTTPVIMRRFRCLTPRTLVEPPEPNSEIFL